MVKYNITENNIHIFDSYLVSKKDFKTILKTIASENETNNVVLNRSIFSMEMEWSTHNFLFCLNIEKERTKDVDFEYPQTLINKILYYIGGIIGWFFIK